MKKGLLLIGLILLITPVFSETICVNYFTYIHCSNCEYTDPIVLDEWNDYYDNLVIIEYVYDSWTDTNAQLLGEFSENYNSYSAVPQLIINEDDIRIGRNNVPNFEQSIGGMESSNCTLLDSSVSFEELNLNELPGEPKVWSNGRLLIRTGNSNVSTELLRELLSTNDLNSIIQEHNNTISSTEPVPAPISGGEITFNNAVKVGNSWILEFNEFVNEGSGSNNTTSTNNSIIDLGIFGNVNADETSLPLFTVLIASADAFNPCAFFILTFLLSAMLYVRSRKRILLVGFIFVFFSGLIYYLFMAAWLNVFLIMGEIMLLTSVAGLIALIAGVINVKDYFAFQKGVSLTLPKDSKKMMQEKVDDLKKKKNIWLLISGSVILAITVNMYELLCTVGFPMIFTRILTMNNLASVDYYFYLLLYNLVYILPLSAIVVIFAITLGSRRISKKNIRRLKLLSGVMITLLGGVLLFKPELLENAMSGFAILLLSILLTIIIILGYEKIYCNYCGVSFNEHEGEEQCPYCGKWFKRLDLHKCKKK